MFWELCKIFGERKMRVGWAEIIRKCVAVDSNGTVIVVAQLGTSINPVPREGNNNGWKDDVTIRCA